MISFDVDPNYILDLEDDFVINESLTLYEFIGDDPVKAFYLGFNIEEWFSKIDKKQRYLYSKQARHNKDDLKKYQNQIEYWSKKYPSDEMVDMVKLSEFIMNNIIWQEESETLDRIKLAFFFGNTISAERKKQDNESMENNN